MYYPKVIYEHLLSYAFSYFGGTVNFGTKSEIVVVSQVVKTTESQYHSESFNTYRSGTNNTRPKKLYFVKGSPIYFIKSVIK